MSWPDVHAALNNALDGNSALATHIGERIYANQANAGAALPYIVFYEAMGLSPNIVPRATLNHVYRIESRSVTPGTATGGAQAIHSAVYNALHGKALTITGWTSWWVMCEREQKFTEPLDGKQYYRFVWDVRIRASENS